MPNVILCNYHTVKKIPKEATVINVTSRSQEWSKGLSPFILGPVDLYDDYVAKNVENAWQFSKVYPCHIDEDDNPSEDYFQWAQEGWEDAKAHRYPMGKGSIPMYSWWDGEKMTYVEAREKVYIPLYSIAARESEAYKTLQKTYLNNDIIYILDFDVYDHKKAEMTYEEVIRNEHRKCGHGFVLAMMLENYI